MRQQEEEHRTLNDVDGYYGMRTLWTPALTRYQSQATLLLGTFCGDDNHR